MTTSKKVFWRIVLDICLFISIINGWWFIALPFGLIGVWLYPHFAEFIIAGVAYDALFGMTRDFGVYSYIGTIVSVVVFTIVTIFKKTVRRSGLA